MSRFSLQDVFFIEELLWKQVVNVIVPLGEHLEQGEFVATADMISDEDHI